MGKSAIDLQRTFAVLQTPGNRAEPEVDVDVARALGQTEAWPVLLGHRYVVVLGEAGTGKTTEFREQAKRLAATGMPAFFLPVEDLADKGLRSSLTPAEEAQFTRWSGDGEEAVFFLDAVDEMKLLGKKLRTALRQLQREIGAALPRARLLLSCRPSDWNPETDLAAFKEILPAGEANSSDAEAANRIHVVQIVPLDEAQVRRLAEHHGITDVEDFARAIGDAHAQMFIGRPRDVEWIAGYWRQHRQLGSLSDLLEHNIREKLAERNPDRNSELAPERARQGVTVLAGVATLSGQRFFLLPEAERDPERAAHALSPRELLDSWSDAELKQLLTRPIFDEATYGRVRFHHRSVQEYLAAQWLKTLIEGGLRRRELNRLLFPKVDDKVVIPPHLGPVIAWLCLWDKEVCHRALEYAPALLMGEGDPSGLSPEERARVLRAHVAEYSDRKRLYYLFDRPSLGRFATPALADAINTLLGEPQQPEELRRTLLEIVKAGRLGECADAALAQALDETAPVHLRTGALEAVAAAGSRPHQERLLEYVDAGRASEPKLADAYVRAMFPGLLDVPGLLRLMATVKPAAHERLRSFGTPPFYRAPRSCPHEWRMELVEGLIRLVGATTDANGKVRLDRRWLLPALSELLSITLGEATPSELEPVQSAIVDGLDLLSRHTYDSNESAWVDIPKLRAALGRQSMARRALFWRRVETAHRKKNKYPKKYWQLPYQGKLHEIELGDAEWLAEDVRNRALVREQLIAWDALLHLARDSRSEDLKALIESLPAHKAIQKQRERLAQRTQIKPDPLADSNHRYHNVLWERRHRRCFSALKMQQEEVRQGLNDGVLGHFYALAGDYGSIGIDLGKITAQYDATIAQAASEGFRRYWSRAEIKPPHERPSSGGIPNEILFAAAGLHLTITDGLDVATLPPQLRRKAIHLALWEPNPFPPWFGGLAEQYPAEVRELSAPVLRADYQLTDNGTVGLHAFMKLSHAPESVRDVCWPLVIDLLNEAEPPREGVLRQALTVALSAMSRDHDRLTRLAAERCCSSSAPRHFRMWWIAWAALDARRAVEHLERRLAAAPDRGTADRWMEEICHGLQEWPLPDSQLYRDSSALRCFIPLVFAYIRPEEDLDREGIYFEPRDLAQELRNKLIEHVASPDIAGGRAALIELAADSRMAGVRDWLLRLADARALASPACAPWTPETVLQWSRDLCRVPDSPEALFQVALDRLDDIQEFLQHGRHSYRELFHVSPGPILEAPVQKWLADRLEQLSRGHYTVTREDEVGDTYPDISLHAESFGGRVSIEVKIAERWTKKELESSLREQLVAQYLHFNLSNYGVFLLCSVPGKKSWEGLSFDELLEHLRQMARSIRETDARVQGLEVIGISFRP